MKKDRDTSNQCFCNSCVKFTVLTINSKCPVKEILCSSNHSTNHRQSSATVFVFLIGFAQQLRLEVPIILTPSTMRHLSQEKNQNNF